MRPDVLALLAVVLGCGPVAAAGSGSSSAARQRALASRRHDVGWQAVGAALPALRTVETGPRLLRDQRDRARLDVLRVAHRVEVAQQAGGAIVRQQRLGLRAIHGEAPRDDLRLVVLAVLQRAAARAAAGDGLRVVDVERPWLAGARAETAAAETPQDL